MSGLIKASAGELMEFLVLIGLIWFAAWIIETKKPFPKATPRQTVDPALESERRANQLRDDNTYVAMLQQWLSEVRNHMGLGSSTYVAQPGSPQQMIEQALRTPGSSGVLNRSRWLPKGDIHRFLAKYPAPKHISKTWEQLVGHFSSAETLRHYLDLHNSLYLSLKRLKLIEFFDTVEKSPLTDEQIYACVCMDDAVMVVAAAGSGKTSTMVAKTGYVLHEGLAKPEQILLLAFNRATADEVGQRIAEQLRGVPNVDGVQSNTFHAFGIKVIGKATGKKPSLAPWVSPDNPGGDVREISEIIDLLCTQDPQFKQSWDLFRTVYGRDVGKWGQLQEPDAYADGKSGFLTAKGNIVKSKEERTIADWLFYNGVEFEYERAYEHDTTTEHYRQYRPDFYFPQIKLYHEHFALNAKGQAPKCFKDYLAGVKWKRQIHQEMGTALIETTSHTLSTGQWIPYLEKELTKRGVILNFNPQREAPGLPPVPQKELARSFRVFQQHVKNNSLTHNQLNAALAEQSEEGFAARLRMYLSLYERIAQEWEHRLRKGNFIDFEDMLIQAAEHVESGRYKSPYTIILADEFQDSSRARIRLLKALAANPGVTTHLCVVGDDWQGVNRFAGSDISVMTEFEKTFEHATRLNLNTTFRCPQHLCDISSQFIQANPAQIKKAVRTTNTLTKTPLLVFGLESEEAMAKHIQSQLELMNRAVKTGKLTPAKGKHITVMFLGRYRDDAPVDMQDWKTRFADTLELDFRTAHGSKGLEAEYVFVLNVVQGTRGFPSQIQDDPALQLAMPTPDPYPFAEERRLFYVAMTRARKQVRLYTTLGNPSQFLIELVKAGRLEIEPVNGEALEPCPKCGDGVLQARPGRHGSFYGCSRFPSCDFTRRAKEGEQVRPAQAGKSQRISQPVDIGDTCPICEKGKIEKKNGRNGPFLGCSQYRQGCKATANIRQREPS